MKIEWDGGTLTKQRALFLCWQMWMWLGEDGARQKEDWPGWKRNGGDVEKMCLDCAMCEFVTTEGDDCIAECLMASYWKGGCFSGKNNMFYQWNESINNAERAKYAKSIAAAAKRRYDKAN